MPHRPMLCKVITDRKKINSLFLYLLINNTKSYDYWPTFKYCVTIDDVVRLVK